MIQDTLKVVDSSRAAPQIQHVVDTIKIQSSDTLELVSKVDQFYNNAWDKLTWGLGIFVTLFGILLPIIFQYFQNRSLRENRQALEEEFNARVSSATNDLEESTRKKLEEMEVRINYVISSRVKSIEAELAFIQKNYEDAAYFHATAARDSLIGDNDQERAISSLRLVAGYLLGIDHNLFAKKFTDRHERLEDVFSEIRKNANGNLTIENLLLEIDNLFGSYI